MILIGVSHKAMLNINVYFFKNISGVFLGNVIAQTIQIFTFGQLISSSTDSTQSEFYFISSVSAFLVGFIGLKYDVAQIRPKTNKDGEDLYKSALIIALTISFFISFFSQKIAFLTFSSFLFNNTILLATRRREFNLLVLGKLLQAILFLSFIYFIGSAFITLYSMSYLISALSLISISKISFKSDWKRMCVLLNKFKNYPRFSVPSSMFMNLFIYSLGMLTPIFVDENLTAKLFQYEKFYLAPILLLGNSFSQVYRAETQHIINKGKSIIKITNQLMFSLLIITTTYYIILTQGIMNNLYSSIFKIQIVDDIQLLYAFGLIACFRAIGMPWMSLFYSKDKLKHDLLFSFLFGLWSVVSLLLIGQLFGIIPALFLLSIGIFILYLIAFITVNPYDRNN